MISTEPTKKTIQLGFIGVGWIGRNRMEVILRDSPAKAGAICEPSKENAELAKTSTGCSKLFRTPEPIFSDPDLEGIVIATPSAMHADQSIEAFRAGKAVFCQKPLGRTAEEVRRVVEASKRADKLLTVDLSYRYTRAFKAVYDLIQKEEIGKIYAVNLTFHNAYGPDKPWFYDIKKSGGGCVMDLGIHLVDLALWSLGFPKVNEVRSHLFNEGQQLHSWDDQVEDFADVTLVTDQGTVVSLNCSWNASAGKDAVIEASFYGTKGGAAVKNSNGSFYDFTAEKYTGTTSEILVAPPDDWGGRAGVSWVNQLLEDDSFDPQTASEYIKTAEVIDRIYGR